MKEGNTSDSARLLDDLRLGMTEEFYRLALDSLSTTIIYTLDSSLIVTYVNLAGVRFIKSLGFPTDIIGQHIAQVFPPLKPSALDRYQKVLRTGELDEENVSYKLPQRDLIAEVKRFPLKKGEETIGILVSVTDVTERHKAENALRESLMRFDQVSHLAGEWLWETDAAGFLIYSSASIEKILGFKAEGLKGRRISDFFSPETKVEATGFLDGLFRRREEFRGFIVRSISRDGREFSLEMAGEPIFDGETFIGYRGVALDITDRLEYEENLIKFKLAVDNASEHIMITDENGVIVYANQAATKLTGYSLKEIIGARPSLWGGLMPREFYEKMWRTIKEERNVFIGEVTNKRKNGSSYIAELRISPVVDSKGSVKFFVGIERDITTAKEIDRAKTEFVSLASHQLRTPLSIISWYVMEILSGEEPLSDRLRDYAEEIKKGSTRMIDLVNALLDVSRIDTGSFLISSEPVLLCWLIESIIADFKKQAEEKGVTLSVDCSNASFVTNLDARLFRIVLQNLVINGIKYTPKGGTVTVVTQSDGDSFTVAVKDTGIGVPEDEREGMFTKFFRASNAKKTDPDGTGLGLYLVKGIMKATGGEVWFESEVGKGAAFFVRFPSYGMKSSEELKNQQKYG